MKKIKIWAGILFVQILFFEVFRRFEFLLEGHRIFFEKQKSFHISIFKNVDFSVGDLLYISSIFYMIYQLGRAWKRRKWKSMGIQLLLTMNVVFFLYQIFWGLLYDQKAFNPYHTEPQKFSKETLENLTEIFLERTLLARKAVDENQNGVFEIKNIHLIKNQIIQDQNSIPKEFQVWSGIPEKSFKVSAFTSIMNYTGILGYYNPFTAEAQYNSQIPSSYLPMTIAHEMAHQIGIARENEANFYAYILSLNSKNAALQYSVNWYILKSLLKLQTKSNPAFVKRIKSKFSTQLLNDLQVEKKYFMKYRGRMNEFFSWTNDWFLKLNQQEGISSYGNFIYEVIAYEEIRHKKRIAP